MPATYAHYKFGEAVRESFPEDKKTIRDILDRNLELFSFGLHGPDIFFYYHPLIPNDVKIIGNMMHEDIGWNFFHESAVLINAESDSIRREKMFAYIAGFICHFVLDTKCHGYIADKMETSGLSHTEVEGQLDRYLMVKDGLDPLVHKPTGHLIPSKDTADIIATFFGGEPEMEEVLNAMVAFLNMIVTDSRLKRLGFDVVMIVLGIYKKMNGLFMSRKPNPKCTDSNEELERRLFETSGKAVELICKYYEYIDDSDAIAMGSVTDEIYNYTYGSIYKGDR